MPGSADEAGPWGTGCPVFAYGYPDVARITGVPLHGRERVARLLARNTDTTQIQHR